MDIDLIESQIILNNQSCKSSLAAVNNTKQKNYLESIDYLYTEMLQVSNYNHKQLKAKFELKNSYHTYYDSSLNILKVNLNNEDLERKFSKINNSIHEFYQERSLIKSSLATNEVEINHAIRQVSTLLEEISIKFNKYKILVLELEQLIKDCEAEKKNTSDIKKMIKIIKSLDPIESIIITLNKNKESIHQLLEIKAVKEGILQDKLYILNSNKDKVALKEHELVTREDKVVSINDEINFVKAEIINIEELNMQIMNEINNLIAKKSTVEYNDNYSSSKNQKLKSYSVLIEQYKFNFTDLISAVISIIHELRINNQFYNYLSYSEVISNQHHMSYNNQLVYCNQSK
jgi:hypothetical protein